MKKTLLLFAMLLSVVGAWAAITQPETGVYVISGDENGRRGNLAACTGIPNFPALSNINWPGTTYGNNSVAAITNGEHWYVLKVYNRYVIYNLGLNKYLVKDGNNINFGDTPYLWQILVNGNYNSIYDEVGTYISFACGTKPSASTRNVKFNNSSTDGGSLHTFTVVDGGEQTYADEIITVTENAPIELSYELTDELGNVYTGMYDGFAGTDLPPLTGLTFTSTRWENNKLFADITFPFPVSDAETTKKMMINGYTYSNQDFKWYAKDNTQIKVNEGSVPTVDNVNNYLWAIYPSVNKDVFTYTIKNIAANKYITSSATTGAHGNNTLAFNETGISFKLVKDSYGYAFKIADKNLYLSINSSTDGKGEQPLGLHGNTHDGTSLSFIPYVVNCKLTDAAGNTFTGEGEGWAELEIEPTFTGAEGYTLTDKVWNDNIFTATIDFKLPVSSETVANPTFISTYKYSNQVADQFKWYASDNKIKVKEGEEIFSSSIASHLWLIYPKFNNGAFTFQIKNVATDLFINSSFSGNGHDDESTVVLSSEATDFTVGKRGNEGAEFINSFGKRLSVNTSKPDPTDKIQTVGTYDTHYGTALTFPDYMESTTWPEFVSTGTTLNPLVIAIGNDVKKTLVAKKLPNSADRYVHVTASNEEPELGYGQWTIYPAFSGNKIGFKIKNIATDTYIYAKPNGASEVYPVVLNAEGTAFDFADSKFAYTDGANTLYLSVPTNESYNLPLGIGTEADETRKTITFPEFSSYQITIGTTGYTTVYSPFTAFTYSEDLEIYTITSAPQDSRVNLNLITSPQADDISNYILENQGVIIKGNSGTYTFYMTDDQGYFDADAWEGNKLSGSFTNTYVQGDAYVLSAPDGVESVGLYKALLNKDANGEDGTTHFKNNAGKAYLPAPAGADARFFLFDFGGEETGIDELKGENGNVKTEVYDLAGRRVQNAKKGIFVINGKVVVK